MATTADPSDGVNGAARPNDRTARHGLMNARDANRAGLRVQAIVERCANRENAAAGTVARLEHHDLASCLPQHASRPQPRESGADDDDGIGRASRVGLGQSLQQRRCGGHAQRGELEKPPTRDVPAHGEV